ncbi:hypothetical protein MalM25_13650 [Planctomycetes bacterium MalM25]|nr:hypothetical protein MalM25_13650 [Planctomycetes bacterium MalM25]
MIRYLLHSPLALFALLACATSQADQLEFIVDRDDGAVYIKNPTEGAITLDGYQILSFGDALLTNGWVPIAGNYDLSGDQSVDATADWSILGVPTSTQVAEASLVAASGSIAAGQIVSLGLFFDTTLLEGLVVTTSAGTETDSFPAEFRTLTADYDNDLDVDLDDYNVFASTYGSAVDLRADGNDDGVIDAADFTVWRDSSELVLTPAEAVLALAVPEPTALAAFSLAGVLLTSAPWRRRG